MYWIFRLLSIIVKPKRNKMTCFEVNNDFLPLSSLMSMIYFCRPELQMYANVSHEICTATQHQTLVQVCHFFFFKLCLFAVCLVLFSLNRFHT